MDNKAYEQYRKANPEVNTPLSTYEDVDLFDGNFTNTEMVICGVFLVLAIYATYKIFFKKKKSESDETTSTNEREQ
jgi:hypothetical protein